MKLLSCILILVTAASAAEEGRRESAEKLQAIPGRAETPWLGLKVGRLDEAIRAHVPRLPAGIGFVVTSVEAGGPAEKAGVKAYDILWKFDDQLIANEAQLFTLLRLHEVADEVALGVYRSGKELSLPLVLGRLPEQQVFGDATFSAAAEVAGLPDAVPMKELNLAAETAKIETADGTAVLSLVAGVPEVKIVAPDGTTLFEGPVYDFNRVSLVPGPWQPRVGALERALAHAMKGSFPTRPPRPRVLPPAAPADE